MAFFSFLALSIFVLKRLYRLQKGSEFLGSMSKAKKVFISVIFLVLNNPFYNNKIDKNITVVSFLMFVVVDIKYIQYIEGEVFGEVCKYCFLFILTEHILLR